MHSPTDRSDRQEDLPTLQESAEPFDNPSNILFTGLWVSVESSPYGVDVKVNAVVKSTSMTQIHPRDAGNIPSNPCELWSCLSSSEPFVKARLGLLDLLLEIVVTAEACVRRK